MTNKHDFAYSVGHIRTLETLLMGDNEVDRMVLAKDAQDAFKILNEFDYSDNKAGIDSPNDFQQVITEGLKDIKDSLVGSTPDQNVLNILWFSYDFHNIKTMLKAKLSDKTFDEIESLLSELGAIPIEALKHFIFEGVNTAFGLDEDTEAYLKAKIKKVPEMFEKDGNPIIIDLYMDQKLMKLIYKIAAASGSEFLLKYVQKLIDLSNVKLFFRMKSQDKALELFEMASLRNGTVPYSKFKEAYKHGLSDCIENLKGTPYGKIIEAGLKHYQEEKSFLHLEKAIEDHLTEFIKQAKLMPFGPEPLIAYYLAKKNNALIIRMILINKLNNIDPEEIRGRLRQLYS